MSISDGGVNQHHLDRARVVRGRVVSSSSVHRCNVGRDNNSGAHQCLTMGFLGTREMPVLRKP